MVNIEELIGTTEHVTLYTRCRLSRCRYNQVRLYIVNPFVGRHISSQLYFLAPLTLGER
jgi:hypothetical protein